MWDMQRSQAAEMVHPTNSDLDESQGRESSPEQGVPPGRHHSKRNRSDSVPRGKPVGLSDQPMSGARDKQGFTRPCHEAPNSICQGKALASAPNSPYHPSDRGQKSMGNQTVHLLRLRTEPPSLLDRLPATVLLWPVCHSVNKYGDVSHHRQMAYK